MGLVGYINVSIHVFLAHVQNGYFISTIDWYLYRFTFVLPDP